MTKLMEKEDLFMLMEMYMKVIGLMTRHKEEDYTNIWTEQNM